MKAACIGLLACLAIVPAVSARITCDPPVAVYVQLQAINFDGPLGTTWTASAQPFADCLEDPVDPDAVCMELPCRSTADCSEATIGGCYLVTTARCSNDPTTTYLRLWVPVNSLLCE